ncbi:Cd2+/Zn2+-exporting ATPase [Dyadobacter sp. BE34]|uniref:P-type Zn(2+) transporter n=1 Tax=Dyadobacter fermentans TaxID=94254 RepID=A0ABU1R8I5_9BACT|nr:MULTISPECIES: heavy metal translocating P-type ATPase [Dyadobacter]MDR6809723.1 Cd2+/Zn2+-exporting ATPase [Dyadobacter fermentans]MDR7047455.1 Cd2+/Zn2+-exporting ATPase [Dyadobacter sp. BE242]MDR7201625.1 Cd2+/Zn2+-exporting ATPase [Dyadobacter sp. BE34]MDR7219495.1 Cd2+/Zn2+-exporting ATPase [Dyadobacter sp. BE31]MDR7267262.1 Cd2+/Zn2+-exporting ATPase [Dyadobacter sp. BE32]
MEKSQNNEPEKQEPIDTELAKKQQHEGHDHAEGEDHDQEDDDDHDHSEGDGHDHSGQGGSQSLIKSRWALWLSLVILLSFLLVSKVLEIPVTKPVEIGLMVAAYVLAGYKTIQIAFRRVKRADFFNEFTLMTTATLGAFYIGEFAEGVAVMIFYELGELFQDLAVNRSKRSIKALLDVRPDKVTVKRSEGNKVINPSDAVIGDIIMVKPGEKVALDSELLTESASFNTAALTGESKPDTKEKGSPVLAGMINLDRPIELKVTTAFKDSKLSRILEMVQDATARKAPTQLFISKFAKIYTPIVFFLALAITVLPYFFVDDYVFNQWLYRGMVFLVISCPCALTISIPLGYFGGIGLASRNGILFKGSNFLDVMTKVDTIVMDKTGTLTKGVFKVQQVVSDMDKEEFLRLTASLENVSTHPVARAVIDYQQGKKLEDPTDVEEIAGHGLKGKVAGKELLAGNLKLLDKFSITYPQEIKQIQETIVVVAVDGKYSGYITIADEIKEDAAQAIKDMHALGIKTVMLSGDKNAVAQKVAKELGIDEAYGDLLPEGKVEKVQAFKDAGKRLAFVGDGVNDAPVVALADAGIAMGGLGSDATIETADVVIQNDQPSRIVSAIRAGKITRSIVWQNIILAMSVKAIVLLLGAGGIATLWEAVFADVGVALLAILNAFRIQRKEI